MMTCKSSLKENGRFRPPRSFADIFAQASQLFVSLRSTLAGCIIRVASGMFLPKCDGYERSLLEMVRLDPHAWPRVGLEDPWLELTVISRDEVGREVHQGITNSPFKITGCQRNDHVAGSLAGGQASMTHRPESRNLGFLLPSTFCVTA